MITEPHTLFHNKSICSLSQLTYLPLLFEPTVACRDETREATHAISCMHSLAGKKLRQGENVHPVYRFQSQEAVFYGRPHQLWKATLLLQMLGINHKRQTIKPLHQQNSMPVNAKC